MILEIEKLSHGLDTCRMLFLVSTDVSLWDMDPTAEQTPLKDLGLVSGWVLLVKDTDWLPSSCLLCVIPSYNSHVIMFRIRAIFHVTIWLRNRKVWAMSDWSYSNYYYYCYYYCVQLVKYSAHLKNQTWLNTINGIFQFSIIWRSYITW